MSKAIVGILGDAFEISNRGVVIIIKLTSEITLNTGQVIQIENMKTPIKGIEMVNYGSLTPPNNQASIGLFVEGKKADFLKLQGSTVFMAKDHDQ